ncbi:MAG: OmpA family protein [Gammaproteobacteria bacterium]
MNSLSRIALAAAIITLAACASTPESTTQLEQAQAAFERAKADPEVLRYASENLDAAEQALDRAAMAEEVEDMNTLAYVANNEVMTARAVAEKRAAEDRVEELSTAKDRIQLEMREAELSASRAALAELQAKQTEAGTVVTLGGVLFATGKAELLPGAMNSVGRLADYLRQNENKTVIVEGHTDSTGSDETNLRLSQARADSVRSALIAQGVSPRRITATGLGSSQPVASNDTSAGRQQNRRVEVIIR